MPLANSRLQCKGHPIFGKRTAVMLPRDRRPLPSTTLNDCFSRPSSSSSSDMVRTRNQKERSRSAVIFGVATAAFLGLILGFAFEVQRPPEFVRSRSALTEGDPLLSPKIRLGEQTSSDSWRRLLQSAENGSIPANPIRLDEGSLNGIAGQYLNFTLGKQQALQSSDKPTYGLLPDTPNFAIDNSALQIAIPFELVLFHLQAKGFLIARGRFDNAGDSPSFVVEEAWINSARLPGVLAKLALNRLTGSIEKTSSDSPLIMAWSQVRSAGVVGDELVLEPR